MENETQRCIACHTTTSRSTEIEAIHFVTFAVICDHDFDARNSSLFSYDCRKDHHHDHDHDKDRYTTKTWMQIMANEISAVWCRRFITVSPDTALSSRRTNLIKATYQILIQVHQMQPVKHMSANSVRLNFTILNCSPSTCAITTSEMLLSVISAVSNTTIEYHSACTLHQILTIQSTQQSVKSMNANSVRWNSAVLYCIYFTWAIITTTMRSSVISAVTNTKMQYYSISTLAR